MNYQQALDYLLGLGHETLAMKFGLRNTEVLLGAFDNPQNSFVKIQIAGTNGKGSTCAFLDAICRCANLKTGLYTSPHLVNITERIKIDNKEIGEQQFADLTAQVRATAQNLIATGELETLPTFFEHLTIIALLAFRAAKVDVAILETGLGGRLDATTAARAEIAAITQIALDHQEYLGDTIEKIAAEKAAIIHENTVAAIVAAQTPEAMRAIRGRCRETEVELLETARGLHVKKHTELLPQIEVNLKINENNRAKTVLSLLGRHQIENAALAVGVAEVLTRNFKFEISDLAILAGLESAEHRGRLELRAIENRRVLFDGAHNRAGARALAEFLQEFYSRSKLTFIFGAMRDKDLDEIGSELFALADKLVFTKINNPRSAAPEDLRATAVLQNIEPQKITLAETFAAAWQIAQMDAPENLIVVTGSLYLVGEAQKFFAL